MDPRTVLDRLTARGRRRLALHDASRPGPWHVDRDGWVGKIRYYAVGPVAADTTVVFIHGFTLEAQGYYLQTEYLCEHHPGVQSLLMDLRGHGETGAFPPEECTVDGLADDALAVIERHAPTGNLIIVGHSLGGMAAFNLVRRAPQLRDRIAGLVIVAASIEPLSSQGIPQILALPAAQAVYDAVEAAPEEADQFREAVTSVIAPGLAVGVFRRPIDYDLIQFHAAMINNTPLETFVGFFDDLQKHTEVHAAAALEGIPGYVIDGELDAVTPDEQADRITELWPDAYRQTAPHTGHMIPLSFPEMINTAISRLIRQA